MTSWGSVPILIVALVLVPAAPGSAQPLAPAPQPALVHPEACPAVVRYDFDVSAVAGADRIQWQLRRGQPGQGFAAATQVQSGNVQATTGSLERDLRPFGPVLDGTRYLFRLRARAEDAGAVSDWSEPVAFEPDLSPDGSFSASPGTEPGTVRVDWNLSGNLAACADHVVARAERAGVPTETVAEVGSSGTATLDVAEHGTGEWEVRLRAGFEEAPPEGAVGRESAPVRVFVTALEPLEESGQVVPLEITSFRLQGGAASVGTGTRITLDAEFAGSPPEQYKAAVCGATFEAAALQPFPAVPPPTLPAFATAGARVVCFQARRGLTSSGVVRDTIEVMARIVSRDFGRVSDVTRAFDLPVEITSFQVRGGGALVTVGRNVSLNAAATGGPTEYRSALRGSTPCTNALATAPWRPFSATSAPTISFAAAGTPTVCFQLRRGTVVSGAAQDDITVIAPTVTAGSFGDEEEGFLVDNLTCGAGRFAVGIHVKSIFLIDALGLECATLGASGGHSGRSRTRLVPGQTGGLEGVLDCPSGEVLLGFEGRSADVIEQLGLACIDWTSTGGSEGLYDYYGPIGGGGGQPFPTVICPKPYAVNAVLVQPHCEPGRACGYIDRITVRCAAPPDL